jgi:hypothetical protein
MSISPFQTDTAIACGHPHADVAIFHHSLFAVEGAKERNTIDNMHDAKPIQDEF